MVYEPSRPVGLDVTLHGAWEIGVRRHFLTATEHHGAGGSSRTAQDCSSRVAFPRYEVEDFVTQALSGEAELRGKGSEQGATRRSR